MDLSSGLHWTEGAGNPLLVRVVLRLVDRARRLVEAAGIEFVRFRSILELKLRLDVRGTSTRSTGAFGLGLVLLLAFGWFAGLLPAFLAQLAPPPALWMAAVQATNMGLVAIVMLLQYGPMLVETTDIGVIAPRPVDDRTLLASRIAHVLVYCGLLSASVAFWPIVAGCFRYPAWAVLAVLPLSCFLSTLLTVGVIAGFYALVLRIFGPVRFQRVALGLQIVLSALFMGGMQLLPRLRHWDAIVESVETSSPLRFLLPPMHFGGLFEVALGEGSRSSLVLAALALLLPLAAGLLALRLASRHFIAGITGEGHARDEGPATWRSGVLSRLGRAITRVGPERAAYDVALCLSRRDRVFLRGGLPQLVGFSFMMIAMSFPSRSRHGDVAFFGGFALYFSAVVFPGVLEMARYGEHAKARWIFHVLPVRDPGLLLAGGTKALLFSILLPFALALAVIVSALSGFTRIADVVLSLEMIGVLVLAGIPFFGNEILFTREQRPGEMNAHMLGIAFCMTFCAGAAAGIHLLARLHPAAQGALMLGLVPVLAILFRRLVRLEATLPPP